MLKTLRIRALLLHCLCFLLPLHWLAELPLLMHAELLQGGEMQC